MAIDVGDNPEQVFSVTGVAGVPGRGKERQCDVQGQRVRSKKWRIMVSGSSFIDGTFVARIGLFEIKIEKDAVIDRRDTVIDGCGAGLTRISELGHPDRGGDRLD